MYIKYLNFPQVPEHLLESVEDILAKPPEDMVVRYFETFQFKPVKQELVDWLNNNIKGKFYAKYQIIFHGIPIHKDHPAFPGDRRIAYNYIIDTGGSTVITSVYDDDKNLIQSEHLPAKTWHSLVVERYHGVEGINPDHPRVALTVTPLLNFGPKTVIRNDVGIKT